MMKVNTVEQYHIMKWLEQNFYAEALNVTLINKTTVFIEDRNGEKATVSYHGKNDIILE